MLDIEKQNVFFRKVIVVFCNLFFLRFVLFLDKVIIVWGDDKDYQLEKKKKDCFQFDFGFGLFYLLLMLCVKVFCILEFGFFESQFLNQILDFFCLFVSKLLSSYFKFSFFRVFCQYLRLLINNCFLSLAFVGLVLLS